MFNKFNYVALKEKVNTQSGGKQDESKNDDNDSEIESESDDEDENDLPSGSNLNASNFEETFMKYVSNWKAYMADIPNALIKCLIISSESDLNKYWNILLSIQLKNHKDITIFCDFLSHTIHQIVSNYSRHSSPYKNNENENGNIIESQSLKFNNDQIVLWLFREH